MKRNLLRTPLIQSATVLLVVSLLVYLTATSVDGSFWSSLATIFMTVFRLAQLSIGLILALFFCLAVLTGIFLGCIAMVSRESAGRMFEQLRGKISDKLLFVRSLVIKDIPAEETLTHVHEADDREDMLAMLEGSLDLVREDQTATDKNVEWLLERLDHFEQEEVFAALLARMSKQEEQVQDVVTRIDQFKSQIDTFQKELSEITRSATDEKVSMAPEEMGDRLEALERKVASVQKEMSATTVAGATEPVTGKDDDQGDATDHRLFAHIKNKAMQEKIEHLVGETLGKDMSYAQVMDHIVKHTSGKTSETIASHPSLTKEYIRYRRENG